MGSVVSQELPANTTLGDYRIHACLSKSATSIIYKASDHKSKTFAIKEFYPAALARRTENAALLATGDMEEGFNRARERFIGTGMVLAKIEHSALVSIRDVFSLNNTAYYVMDFEEAFSLDELLSHSPKLEYDDLKNIIFPLLDAFRILHEQQIYHLSLGTGNLLIRRDGSPLICGFGAADASLVADATLADNCPVDAAPLEFFSRDPAFIGPCSDIYLLARIFYRCIAGQNPASARRRYQAQQESGKDPIVSISTAGKDRFAAALLSAIDSGLQLRPDARPASISAWSHAMFSLSDREAGSRRAERINKDEAFMEDAYNEAIESRHKLARSYLAGKHYSYYMAMFLQQEARGLLPLLNFNPAAFVFGPLWMVYRKMYVFTLLLLPILGVPLLIATYLLLQGYVGANSYLFFSPALDAGILLGYFLLCLLLGLFGNYMYYLHILRRLKKAAKKQDTVSTQRKYLAKAHPVSMLAAVFAALVLGAAIFFSPLFYALVDGL